MQLGQPLDQSQPDAQATVRPIERRLDLREHLENRLEPVGRNSFAAIPDLDHNLVAVLLDTH